MAGKPGRSGRPKTDPIPPESSASPFSSTNRSRTSSNPTLTPPDSPSPITSGIKPCPIPNQLTARQKFQQQPRQNQRQQSSRKQPRADRRSNDCAHIRTSAIPTVVALLWTATPGKRKAQRRRRHRQPRQTPLLRGNQNLCPDRHTPRMRFPPPENTTRRRQDRQNGCTRRKKEQVKLRIRYSADTPGLGNHFSVRRPTTIPRASEENAILTTALTPGTSPTGAPHNPVQRRLPKSP